MTPLRTFIIISAALAAVVVVLAVRYGCWISVAAQPARIEACYARGAQPLIDPEGWLAGCILPAKTPPDEPTDHTAELEELGKQRAEREAKRRAHAQACVAQRGALITQFAEGVVFCLLPAGIVPAP